MPSVEELLTHLPDYVGQLKDLYTDLHAHPELSMQETRTSRLVAHWLQAAGLRVITGLGGTGVAGILENGQGPIVMLRADMDALPVKEETGLPYASKVTARTEEGHVVPVMHACGHDMHMTWLLGAAILFADHRETWQGTLVAVFQPNEETGWGAMAMLDDGLAARIPRPDVILGQHLMPLPSGTIGYRPGPIMSSVDTLTVRLRGRGAHGSMPASSVDPIVMAAAVILRLQTIVAREVLPGEHAVVTVGKVEAGAAANVIPDEAVLGLSVRSLDETVRSRILESVRRIIHAEAAASGALDPPEITHIDGSGPVINSRTATKLVVDAFSTHCRLSKLQRVSPSMASEDFATFGETWGVPYVFWFIGGTDPSRYEDAKQSGRIFEIPTNHSPRFAPVLEPTLSAGVEALVVAASGWVSH